MPNRRTRQQRKARQANDENDFLTLIPEVRSLILSTVLHQEHRDDLEPMALPNGQISLCLPLQALTPPSLARVCTQLRAEYLHLYFTALPIRFYTLATTRLVHKNRAARACPWTLIPTRVDAWLTSLDVRGEAHFQHVSFRLQRPAGGQGFPDGVCRPELWGREEHVTLYPDGRCLPAREVEDEGWSEYAEYREKVNESVSRFRGDWEWMATCLESGRKQMTWRWMCWLSESFFMCDRAWCRKCLMIEDVRARTECVGSVVSRVEEL